jgi:hypothetical protein
MVGLQRDISSPLATSGSVSLVARVPKSPAIPSTALIVHLESVVTKDVLEGRLDIA